MINCIGNCGHILDNYWIEKASSMTGDVRPNDNMSNKDSTNDQKKLWENAGIIGNQTVQWELFYKNHFEREMELDKVDIFANKTKHWWIVKINPGKCFPIHRDSFTEFSSYKRYWIALTDHQLGHVFMVGNTILIDYKKGDIFEFENIDHGAMNVGLNPKFSLQVVVNI